MKIIYYKPTIFEQMKQAIDTRGWDQRIQEFILTPQEFDEFLDQGSPENAAQYAHAGYTKITLPSGKVVYQYGGANVRVEDHA